MPGRRRGISAFYTVVILSVMMGFAAIAVDYGRLQLAKTELLRAAEAAARYAATGISDSTYLAKAQAAALENKADESAVSLQASDVVIGRWTGGVFTAAGTPTNAVAVTARRTKARGNAVPRWFARVISPTDVDLVATATATISASGPNYGFVGLSGMNLNGSPVFDSYNSSIGSYGGANVGSSAAVASNGSWNLSGTINGNLYYRGSQPSNGTVTGTRSLMSANLTYPNPTTPGSYTNHGNVTVNSGTYTATSGNYYFTNLTIGGTTVVNISATSGPVKFYVNGACNLGGTGAINVTGNLPSNFEIHMVSSAGVDIGSGKIIYAKINAPNSPLNMGSNSHLYGSAVMSQFSTNSGVKFHQDLAIAGSSGTASVTTVR